MFADGDNLSAPARASCLDGCVTHRPEAGPGADGRDGRAHRVEVRRDLFRPTRHDFALALPSAKEAAAWEKAIVKGVAWYGEQVGPASESAVTAGGRPPPPPFVLIGHAASLTPY